MCRNGRYTERGMEIDGFMSERWRIKPEYAMKVDLLARSPRRAAGALRPWSPRAWEQVAAVGQRAFWEPRRVLVAGAGPIGLLAALVGVPARAGGPRAGPGRGRAQAGAGPRAGRDLSRARWVMWDSSRTRSSSLTGVGQVIADSMAAIRRGGVSHRRRHRGPDRPCQSPTPRPAWCSGTWCSWAASTPTSGTGTKRVRCWPARIARGSGRLVTRREQPGGPFTCLTSHT